MEGHKHGKRKEDVHSNTERKKILRCFGFMEAFDNEFAHSRNGYCQENSVHDLHGNFNWKIFVKVEIIQDLKYLKLVLSVLTGLKAGDVGLYFLTE